jgi:type I restriction enzyme S subunit
MTYARVPLGTVARIKHGWAFPGEGFTDDGERVLLTPGSFHERGGFKPRGEREKYYVGDFPSEFLLSPGDVLVCMTDLKQDAPLLGGSMRVPEEGAYLHNQRLGLVRLLDPDATDLAFLYYAFNLESFRAQVRASATGTTVRHTAPERMYRCDVPHPPRDVQRRIAAILTAYDDLIDVNERRVRLLEESIRVLYREWFERLRFPGHQRVVVRDGVPEGWRECRLGDVARVNDRTLSPRSAPSRIGYIDISSVSPGRVDAVTEMAFAEAPSRARRLVADGDILWSTVRPERRSYALLTDPDPNTVASTGFAVITPTTVPPAWLYCAVTRDAFVAYLASIARGTSYPAVTGTDFPPIGIVVPDGKTLAAFDAAAAPTFRQIHTLNLQSRAAARARDALLPRLMDGTLAPPDVAAVEAVG